MITILNESNANIEYRCNQADKDVTIERVNVETKKVETHWLFNRMTLAEIIRTMKAGDHLTHNPEEDSYHTEHCGIEGNYLNVRCDKMTSNKLRDRYQALFLNK